MNLLAIDTSTEMASVALMVGDAMYIEEQGSQRTHAQLLLPMIDRLLQQAGLLMQQLDGVVFGCGPGSFTGLRIACSIAKGLAYAHQLPLYAVSSLASIASSVKQMEQYAALPLLVVLDARMQELYWNYYSPTAPAGQDRVSPAKEIQIPEDKPLVLAGVGIDLYSSEFSEQLKSQVIAQLAIYPSAAQMIHLVKSGQIQPVSVTMAQPVYVRNQVTQGDRGG